MSRVNRGSLELRPCYSHFEEAPGRCPAMVWRASPILSARAYNGPNFAVNRYDIRLNAECQKYSSGMLPDLNVRAAQLYMTYLGFHPGPVDGIRGRYTLSALTQFQTQAGLPNTGEIDGDTVAQLQAALTPCSGMANVA